jgi:hypothetical protein
LNSMEKLRRLALGSTCVGRIRVSEVLDIAMIESPSRPAR